MVGWAWHVCRLQNELAIIASIWQGAPNLMGTGVVSRHARHGHYGEQAYGSFHATQARRTIMPVLSMHVPSHACLFSSSIRKKVQEITNLLIFSNAS
jgi:hypothetical protein